MPLSTKVLLLSAIAALCSLASHVIEISHRARVKTTGDIVVQNIAQFCALKLDFSPFNASKSTPEFHAPAEKFVPLDKKQCLTYQSICKQSA
jgi:hypothetical protein